MSNPLELIDGGEQNTGGRQPNRKEPIPIVKRDT
jgi:hypothetical protein